jgi:hypothetical protein
MTRGTAALLVAHGAVLPPPPLLLQLLLLLLLLLLPEQALCHRPLLPLRRRQQRSLRPQLQVHLAHPPLPFKTWFSPRKLCH